MLMQCPQHNFTLPSLNQAFYDGLNDNGQSMVDNAAGGSIGAKTPEETKALFEMLSANYQQKISRGRTRGVLDLTATDNLSKQIAVLSSKFDKLTAQGTSSSANVLNDLCAYCGLNSHATNMCPSGVQFGCDPEQVNAMYGHPPRHPQNMPYSNTYNPGWRNHPNFSWGGNQNQQNKPLHPPPPQGAFERKKEPWEEAMEQMRAEQQQAAKNHEAAMKKMETQIGQMAEAFQALQGHKSGTFPSQGHQAKAITTLRNGKQVGSEVTSSSSSSSSSVPPLIVEIANEDKGTNELGEKSKVDSPTPNPHVPAVPFPERFMRNKMDQQMSELMDMFSKVNINLPLLNVIKNIPAYAKFFKEVNSKKPKYGKDEKAFLGEYASAVVQQNLPPK